MRRREFITLLGSAAALPHAARAQQPPRAVRIGCLIPATHESHGPFIVVFRQGLGELGHVEGRDYVLDLFWAEGKVERFPMLADELARLAPDVAVAATSAAALAAKQGNADDPYRLPVSG